LQSKTKDLGNKLDIYFDHTHVASRMFNLSFLDTLYTLAEIIAIDRSH